MLRYSELKEVFKLMNHADAEKNFHREIDLFDRAITKLNDLFQTWKHTISNCSAESVGGQSAVEGGATEYKERKTLLAPLYLNQNIESYGSSNLTNGAATSEGPPMQVGVS